MGSGNTFNETVGVCEMKIVVWANGMWEYKEDCDEIDFNWMSDDFRILTVPEDAEEGQIENIVAKFNRGEPYA